MALGKHEINIQVQVQKGRSWNMNINSKRSLYYWHENEKIELAKYEKVFKSWTLCATKVMGFIAFTNYSRS